VFTNIASNPSRSSLPRDTEFTPRSTAPDIPLRPHDVLIVLTLLAASLVATSGRSLWIDEACTAMKAMQPGLPEWWNAMAAEKTADIQMPLYMLYVWIWARLLGWSEWSLHLSNVPWFVIGASVFVLSFSPGTLLRKTALGAALVCPFAWYCLDEARPYAMQIGAGLVVVGSLQRMVRSPESRAATLLFVLGLGILSGSSLLGMVWAASAGICMVVLLPLADLRQVVRRDWNLLLIAAVPLLAVAAFYLWTLRFTAHTTAAAHTTLGSAAYAAYELLGFSGLGPGRLQMRDGGFGAFRSHLPVVGLYCVAAGMVAAAALVKSFTLPRGRQLALILCCAAPPAFILAVGWFAHFRVLGRHLAPFVPVWLLLLAFGLETLWAQKHAVMKLAAVVFCLLSLISCLSVRFAPRHGKDDYRSAALTALESAQEGKTVWWNAAWEGAQYYHLPLIGHGSETGARWLMNPTRQDLENLPSPACVIASKPDVYDAEGAISRYLHERNYSAAAEYRAFTVWTNASPAGKQ
jgi:hypothetical protein